MPPAKLSIHVISNPVLSGEKSAVAVLSCKSRFLSSFEMTVVFFLKIVPFATVLFYSSCGDQRGGAVP